MRKISMKKKSYIRPKLNRILLDCQISLVLQSAPDDPESFTIISPEFSNNNPFKYKLNS